MWRCSKLRRHTETARAAPRRRPRGRRAVLQRDDLGRSKLVGRGKVRHRMQPHARAGAYAKAVAALVMLAKQDAGRTPEGADQVLLGVLPT